MNPWPGHKQPHQQQAKRANSSRTRCLSAAQTAAVTNTSQVTSDLSLKLLQLLQSLRKAPMPPPMRRYPTYTLQQVQSFLGQQALFATLCEPHSVPELPLEQKHKSTMGSGCSLLTTRLSPISSSKLRNLQRPAGDDGTEYTL